MPDYNSDAGLLDHLQKQDATIDQFKNEAGASGSDITEIHQDYANLVAILKICPVVDDYKTTAFGIKRTLLRGLTTDVVGTFADAPDTTMPFPLMAGIEKRSRERDARFKLSTTMTEAARIALDLADAGNTPLTPGAVTPTIELHAAQTNYEFAVVIANRADSDMTDVQIRRAGSEKWETVKSGTGKSINVVITPTTPGQAEKIEVRVILRRKNEIYGQPSAPAYVTVSP